MAPDAHRIDPSRGPNAGTLAANRQRGPSGTSGPRTHRGGDMQTSQPRDMGVLALVIGLFIILLLVTVLVGAPAG